MRAVIVALVAIVAAPIVVSVAIGGMAVHSSTPPPIRAGHCAVLRYEGSAALEQRCAYDGASWLCLGNRCERGEALRIEAEMGTR